MNISGNQTSLQALFEAAEAVVSKSVVTSQALSSPAVTVNTSSSHSVSRRGKHNSMSQGKLRVINQGIHSENIQSPSRQESGRRRSGKTSAAD